MTASSRTTTPRFARVDATSPAPWRTLTAPQVVHLGQSALILSGDRGQLVITSSGFGLAPGGVQLRPDDLARLRTELAAGRRGIEHWAPDVVEPVDLRVTPVRLDPDAVQVLVAAAGVPQRVGGFDPARQRSEAPALARSAVTAAPAGAALLRLIGAGPGSTPSGDDVVVGVLAGLHATGRPAAAERLGAGVIPLLARTTSASAHYLRAAADGRFAERIHELVGGLSDARSARLATEAAGRWGATSGLDLLAGLVAAVDVSAPMRRTA